MKKQARTDSKRIGGQSSVNGKGRLARGLHDFPEAYAKLVSLAFG
jgi:hypothetical protein